MNCKSCQTELLGRYCHSCGQKRIERFSFRSLSEWFRDDIVVLDKGFLFTIKELLLRPVQLVNSYLSGVTQKYSNPYKLLLIFTSIMYLIAAFDENWSFYEVSDSVKDSASAFSAKSFDHFMKNWGAMATSNLLVYFLLTIPFWSFFSFLLFRKRKLHYLEHLIYVSYLSSAMLVCLIITALVMGLLTWSFLNAAGVNPETVGLIIPAVFLPLVIFMVMTSRKFYDENYFKTIGKGILTGWLGVLSSMVLQFFVIETAKVFSRYNLLALFH